MSGLYKRFAGALVVTGALMGAMPAQAVLVVDIDFSEVAIGTPDPTIDGLAFFAGDGTVFEDTATDDGVTPGNPYLVAGIEGSAGDHLPGLTSTSFIGAALAALGGAGNLTTIALDVGFFAALPTAEEIVIKALLGGVQQGTASVTTASSAYQPLSIALDELSFDALQIYVNADFGSAFRLDNLTVDVTPKSPGPGPSPAPAPATLLLMGAGLVAMRGACRRRKAV